MIDEKVDMEKVASPGKESSAVANSLFKESQEIDAQFEGNPDYASRRETWVNILTDLRKAEEQGLITREESIYVQATLFARDSVLSERDPLTDLPNRRGFMLDFIKTRAHLERTEEPLSVGLVDLDNLREINATLGYGGGDKALVSLADYLKKYLREEDLIARFGGDEYIVVFSGQTRAQSLPAMERIKLKIQQEQPDLKFSVGIAQVAGEYDLTELFQLANVAIHKVKDKGKDQIVVWEEGMPKSVKELQNG